MFPPVATLVPHQGRAVLIDAVLADSENNVRAVAHITAEHPFFMVGRGVPSWVGIELMAQTIAAHAGLAGRRQGRAPRAGMLLGTRRYHAELSYFPEGARLEIEAERSYGGDGDLAACDCRIQCDGEILVKATIIIVETEAENMA